METVLEEADPEVLTRPDALDHVEMHQDLAAIVGGASPVQLLENDEMHRDITTRLQQLPAKEYQAVNLHFGIEDGVERSRYAVARMMKTDFREVTQLLRSAFRRLQPRGGDSMREYSNIGVSAPDRFAYLY